MRSQSNWTDTRECDEIVDRLETLIPSVRARRNNKGGREPAPQRSVQRRPSTRGAPPSNFVREVSSG